jgi:cell division protein FtsW
MTAPSQYHAFSRDDQSPLANWWWTTDRWLLGATGLLIVLGVLLSFTSSPAAAGRMNISDPFHFAVRQSVFAALGAVIVLAVSTLSPRGVKRTCAIIYLVAVLIMIALPFLGHAAKGATRWLQLGGFSLQPSELMKPSLIVLAAWMFAEGQKGQGVPGVSIAFGLLLLSCVLLLIQPDFGQTMLITSAFSIVFWIAGMPLIWIVLLPLTGGLLLGGGYLMFSHVASRFDRFFNPGSADTHQVDRAMEAIANGGLFGIGPGEGVMKRHVPDLHTDFIYSVAAEEYGLIFSLGLIGLFAYIVLRGLSKAMKLSDSFGQAAAAGLFVLLGEQAVINVAVNLNLIPTKGMTLPFLSYGGSSMFGMALTLGLALALTRRRPGAYAQSEPHGQGSPAL